MADKDVSKQATVQTLSNREEIDLMKGDISQLKKAIATTLDTVNTILENITRNTPANKMPKRVNEQGVLTTPSGDFKFENTVDPSTLIEIAVLTNGDSLPRTMQFPDPADQTGQRLLTYTFRLDEKKRAHYLLPLMFAASQLRNDGGQKSVLVYPEELQIEKRGADMRTETITIRADADFNPVF